MRPRKISELGDAIWFKLGHEGVPVLLPIAQTLEIEIKGVKECGGIDKENIRAGHQEDGKRGQDRSSPPVDDGG